MRTGPVLTGAGKRGPRHPAEVPTEGLNERRETIGRGVWLGQEAGHNVKIMRRQRAPHWL